MCFGLERVVPDCRSGVREGHEPYRFTAMYAALELLSLASYSTAGAIATHSYRRRVQQPSPAQAQWLLAVLPEVVMAVKAGLNTMQPSLAANMLLMLQR